MESDCDITVRKYLLKNVINKKLSADEQIELERKICETVKQCNFLRIHLCFMLRAFIIKKCETNIENIDELVIDLDFIKYGFRLLRFSKDRETGKNKKIDNNKKLKDELKTYFETEYKEIFVKQIQANWEKQEKLSLNHITDDIAVELNTNILNNIRLNFEKYVKEYVKLKLNKHIVDNGLNFTTKTKNSQVLKIFDDVTRGTSTCDDNLKDLMLLIRNTVIPKFNGDMVSFKNIEEAINNDKFKKPIFKLIRKYIDDNFNIYLSNENITSFNTKPKYNAICCKLFKYVIGELNEPCNFEGWINLNKTNILNFINKDAIFDIRDKLDEYPYKFIKFMFLIKKELDVLESKKKYQFFPLKTATADSFINIHTNSLIDILPSSLTGIPIKNNCHDKIEIGYSAWERLFDFNNIKNNKGEAVNLINKSNIHKFGYTIKTDGFEICIMYSTTEYKTHKQHKTKTGNESKKKRKDDIKNMTAKQIVEYDKNIDANKKKLLSENNKLRLDKQKQLKETNKLNEANKLKQVETEINAITEIFTNNKMELSKKLTETEYKNQIPVLECNFEHAKTQILNQNSINANFKILTDNLIQTKKSIEELKTKMKILTNEIQKQNKLLVNDEIVELKKRISDFKKQRSLLVEGRVVFGMFVKKLQLLHEDLKISCSDEAKTQNYHNKLHVSMNKIYNDMMKRIEILFNDKHLTLLNHTLVFALQHTYFKSKLNLETFEKIIKTLYFFIDSYIEEYDDIINPLLKQRTKLRQTCVNDEFMKNRNKVLVEIDTLNKQLSNLNKIELTTRTKLMKLFRQDNKLIYIDDMTKENLELVNTQNWVVIDPGSKTIFKMMSKDGKEFEYNRRHKLYKTKELTRRKKRLALRKTLELDKLEEKLKTVKKGSTSCDYAEFINYINLKNEIYIQSREKYNNVNFRKLKWQAYVNEKREESNMMNSIKKFYGKDTLMILGDWSMKGMRKGTPTPNIRYTRLLKNNFNTVYIDEFRTSKIHNKQNVECENFVKKFNMNELTVKQQSFFEKATPEKQELLKKDKSLHSVLTYKLSDKYGKCVNRDVNSNLNMKRIVENYISNNSKLPFFVRGIEVHHLSKDEQVNKLFIVTTKNIMDISPKHV